MATTSTGPSRRNFLATIGVGAAAATATSLWRQRVAEAFAETGGPGAVAEALIQTPRQTEGPFYPDKLPLDTDNDLLVVNDALTLGVGDITHLSGRILDAHGEPIKNAHVEIWQVDHTGSYIHSRGTNRSAPGGTRDANFQGFGRFMTASTGEYYFRTIKPVKYPGRCPHIHFKVKIKGKEALTTQCYIKGEPANERDGVFTGIRDAKQRAAVAIDFAPIKESKLGELNAKFDIVLGFTPAAD